MNARKFSMQLDDIDSRFLFVLSNMDAVRRMLLDSGSANFENHCDVLYATQMMFEKIHDELTALVEKAMKEGKG